MWQEFLNSRPRVKCSGRFLNWPGRLKLEWSPDAEDGEGRREAEGKESQRVTETLTFPTEWKSGPKVILLRRGMKGKEGSGWGEKEANEGKREGRRRWRGKGRVPTKSDKKWQIHQPTMTFTLPNETTGRPASFPQTSALPLYVFHRGKNLQKRPWSSKYQPSKRL